MSELNKKEMEQKEIEAKEAEAKAQAEAEEKELDGKIKSIADKILGMVNAGIDKGQDERKAGMYEQGEKKFDVDVKDMTPEQKTGEFIKALLTNAREKLQVLVEGTADLGGYLVPDNWLNQIVESKEDASVIRPRATVVQVTTDTIKLPKLATRPKVYWTGENATKSTSTATFGEITFTPYVCAVIVPLSRQLVMDASVGLPAGIISYITKLVSQAMAKEEDRVFMNGTGTNQPTGLSTYSLVSIDAGGAVDADDLIALYYKLGQGYRNSAVWVMNSRTIANVKALKDGSGRYVFTDAVTEGGYPTLLGRPVLEQNDTASSEIYFGDLSAYYIAQREGITMMQSEEATVAGVSAFEKNLVFVRVEQRLDAELADESAVVKITNSGVS